MPWQYRVRNQQRRDSLIEQCARIKMSMEVSKPSYLARNIFYLSIRYGCYRLAAPVSSASSK